MPYIYGPPGSDPAANKFLCLVLLLIHPHASHSGRMLHLMHWQHEVLLGSDAFDRHCLHQSPIRCKCFTSDPVFRCYMYTECDMSLMNQGTHMAKVW